MDVATYLDRSDIQGKTALHQAAISNNEAVLEGLAGHASIDLEVLISMLSMQEDKLSCRRQVVKVPARRVLQIQEASRHL